MPRVEGDDKHMPEQVETVARIVAIHEGGRATMVAERRSACESCTAKTGCGVSSLSGIFGARRLTFAVLQAPPTAKAGDDYVIGIPQSLLLKLAAATYLAPILTMIGAAAVVAGLGGGDGLAAVAAGAGLIGGIGGARFLVDRPSMVQGVRPSVLHPVKQDRRQGVGCRDAN